ncbi:MAG: hypothetical protein K2H35_05505, partial [Muribaculaceae bacterium]|nr:hypothetical protein [Muribaculaceae bacterium]
GIIGTSGLRPQHGCKPMGLAEEKGINWRYWRRLELLELRACALSTDASLWGLRRRRELIGDIGGDWN